MHMTGIKIPKSDTRNRWKENIINVIYLPLLHTESDAETKPSHAQQHLHLLGPCAEAKNMNVPVVQALIHMTHIDFPELS